MSPRIESAQTTMFRAFYSCVHLVAWVLGFCLLSGALPALAQPPVFPIARFQASTATRTWPDARP